MNRIHNHYFKPVPPQSQDVDVYRVLLMFSVTDPCIQHAIKKLLVAGGRGSGKNIEQDIQEALDSLSRWQEMREEEQPAVLTPGQAASILNDNPDQFELQSAKHRIYDMLIGDDGQAWKEAEKFLQRASPGLYKLLQTHRAEKALKQQIAEIIVVPSPHPI